MAERGGGVTWRTLSERVRELVTSQVTDELRDRPYSPAEAQDAAAGIAERCMIAIREVTSEFKIMISSVVVQKMGAGVHAVSSCYWDSMADGSTVVRWENSHVIAIVTVYAIKLE